MLSFVKMLVKIYQSDCWETFFFFFFLSKGNFKYTKNVYVVVSYRLSKILIIVFAAFFSSNFLLNNEVKIWIALDDSIVPDKTHSITCLINFIHFLN